MGFFEENEQNMQTILERGLGILAQNYTVRKLDAGEFAAPITMNTQFRIAHYEIENVGHLMTMYTEGNPQMQMVTYTLTPYFKKLPMISTDFVFGADGGMFMIEVYELVENREDAQYQEWIRKYADKLAELSDIADIPTKPAFYDPFRPVFVSKKRTYDRDAACFQNLIDIMKIFIEQENAGEKLTEEEAAAQKAIQHKYVDDLIDLNGVSTMVWVKDHGADYVRRFFHEIFFGV